MLLPAWELSTFIAALANTQTHTHTHTHDSEPQMLKVLHLAFGGEELLFGEAASEDPLLPDAAALWEVTS